MKRFIKDTSQEITKEKSALDQTSQASKPLSAKQATPPGKAGTTENNIAITEIPISSSDEPDTSKKESKEPVKESKNTTKKFLENFYVTRTATQMKREEAELAEKKLEEERVRLQKTMFIDLQRQAWNRDISQTLADLINYGNLSAITDALNKAKEMPPKKVDIDTIARALAFKNKGVLCGLLSEANIDLNKTTERGELVINLAIQIGDINIIKVLLYNPHDQKKTLAVNVYIADSCGISPFLYLENNKKNLSESSYLEIKQTLENARNELDEIYLKTQDSVKEESTRLQNTLDSFKKQMASSTSNTNDQLELNQFTIRRFEEFRSGINNTILSQEQKKEILKPLEDILKNVSPRRSNSVSSFFPQKPNTNSDNTKPNAKPPTTQQPENNTFGRRLRSLTSTPKLLNSASAPNLKQTDNKHIKKR